MPLLAVCNELQQKAQDELNEVPNTIQENLDHIKEWLREQSHLNSRTDEQWLINFLRVSKYDIEKSKKRIEMFHTCKAEIPDFFSNRDSLLPEIQYVLDRKLITVLPNTVGPAGPRLILNRASRADPKRIPVETYMKVFCMVLDILCIEDTNSTIAGVSIINDLKGMYYGYAMQITPKFVKRFMTCLQNAYPVRIKAIYIVNAPSFFVALYNIVKMFLSDKIRNRVHFYSNVDDCYNDVPSSVLPKEYGGEQASCDEISDEWKLKIESYRDWFLDDERLFQQNEKCNEPFSLS